MHLICNKACIEENKDCSEHTIKVNQFDPVTYIHKDKEKKELKLLDKMMKPKELIGLLKFKLGKFVMHRFNVEHAAKFFDNLINNLNVNSILKIIHVYFQKKSSRSTGCKRQQQYIALLSCERLVTRFEKII